MWLTDVDVILMGLPTPSALSVLSLTPPFGDPVLSPTVVCEHLSLYLSSSSRAFQEIAIPVSCQQALLGIPKNLGFVVCIWHASKGGAFSGWPFLKSLPHTLSLYFLIYVFHTPL